MTMILLVLVVVVGAVAIAGLSGLPAQALADGPSVAPGSRALVVRFIERSRRYRRGGAWVGILLALLVAVVAEAEGRPLIGERGVDLGVLFAIGLAGSVAGAVAAEAFRFRPRRGARTASLEVRDLDRYDDPVTGARLVGVGVAALVAAIAGALVGAPELSLWLVPIGLLAGLRWWATRRIALRSRPALRPELAEADDHVRVLAASAGIGRPLATLSLLLLHFQLLGLANAASAHGEDTGRLEGVVTIFAGVGSFAALVLAVVWWAANRSFGLEPRPGARRSRASLGRACLIMGFVLLPVVVVVAARS